MSSRLPRLLALSLSLLVQTDAASVSLVSIQALAAAAEEANSGIEGGEASPAEVLDTVESSEEEQSSKDDSKELRTKAEVLHTVEKQSSKDDSKELSTKAEVLDTVESSEEEQSSKHDSKELGTKTEVLDTVESSAEEQSSKHDSKELRTKSKGEDTDEDAIGEDKEEEQELKGDKSKIDPATRQLPVKTTAHKADPILKPSTKQLPAHLTADEAEPTGDETNPIPQQATKQQHVNAAAGIAQLADPEKTAADGIAKALAEKPEAGIAKLAQADAILGLARLKGTSEVTPVHSLAAQAHEDPSPVAPQAQQQVAQSVKSEAAADSVQPEEQPSGKSSALIQTAVPDIVPSDVDTVSYLAESENQEHMALEAEGVAATAEAAVATSSARLLKTKAFVEELRKSASAKGQDADKDERVQMSSLRVHTAEREVSATSARAEQALSVAKQARLAAMQLSSKMLPNVALIETTHLIQAYGPQSCISTWRDSQSGKCFLKTDCAQVSSFAEYDIGFLCEKEGQESAEHRYGASSFAAQEVQQTNIACDRCQPLQDETMASDHSDVSTPALRGASAAPLN